MRNLKNSRKIKIYGKVILLNKYKKKQDISIQAMKIKENKDYMLMQNKKN